MLSNQPRCDIDSQAEVPLNPQGFIERVYRKNFIERVLSKQSAVGMDGILMGVSSFMQPSSMQPDTVLNACGLSCPLPLLKAKQALSRLSPGELLEVQATDAGSWRDFASFTEQSEHELMARETRGDIYHYWIRKGGAPIS